MKEQEHESESESSPNVTMCSPNGQLMIRDKESCGPTEEKDFCIPMMVCDSESSIQEECKDESSLMS